MPHCNISLPESLDISEVSHFHSELIAKLNEFDEFEIDDSQLVNIDTAGAQLLLALALEIKSTNKKLIWKKPTELVETTFKQLAISELVLT